MTEKGTKEGTSKAQQVRTPLQFAGLVAYVVSGAFLTAGVKALGDGYTTFAWTCFVVSAVLALGVTLAILRMLSSKSAYRMAFHPGDIPIENLTFLANVAGEATLRADHLDPEGRALVHAVLGATLRQNRLVTTEIMRSIEQRQQEGGRCAHSIDGLWEGIVNGRRQTITIRQLGPVVHLRGAVDPSASGPGYAFVGEGRLVAGVLVFSWGVGAGSGVNVMVLSEQGDILDGQYFSAGGASGQERYERAGPIEEEEHTPE